MKLLGAGNIKSLPEIYQFLCYVQ